MVLGTTPLQQLANTSGKLANNTNTLDNRWFVILFLSGLQKMFAYCLDSHRRMNIIKKPLTGPIELRKANPVYK